MVRPIQLNQPRSIRVFVTVGDDGKAAISSRLPVIRCVVGTRRRGLYPDAQAGEWLWIPGLCLEGIDHVMGFLPPPCDPVACTMNLTPIAGEGEPVGGQDANRT